MSIWKKIATLEQINQYSKNTIMQHLDIRFTQIGDDYLVASMPVDHRTHQPMGILHGGASVVLAETLGSIAGDLACEEGFTCVGLEINANHLRPVTQGIVTGTTKALHIGRSTQVWEIKIHDDQARLNCVSRISLSVIKRAP